MPVTIQQILSTTTVITELTPPPDNKAKSAKQHGMQYEQVGAASDKSNNLTEVSMARLLASCGDCI